MKNVFYVGHYALDQDINDYKYAVPAKVKMDYIISAILEAGFKLEVWSLSDSKTKRFQFARCHKVSEVLSVYHIFSIKVNGRLSRLLSHFSKNIQLFLKILCFAGKDDTVLVYHSLAFVPGIKIARKFKKFKLVMDVEELYSHSWGRNEGKCKAEEAFLEKADAFILVNDTISNTVRINNKPSTVVYGAYTVPKYKELNFGDDLIHVVYAGTIEETKLGALTAVDSAIYLNNKYRLHVLGFGKEKAIKRMQKRIDEINEIKGYSAVSYEGFLSGVEFSDFLLKCSIGISSYIMSDKFSNNVFPSKLLTYVSHNLNVVAGYSEAFKKSKVSKNWTYFYEYEPSAIANAVLSVDLSTRCNNRELVCNLHKEFVSSLHSVL